MSKTILSDSEKTAPETTSAPSDKFTFSELLSPNNRLTLISVIFAIFLAVSLLTIRNLLTPSEAELLAEREARWSDFMDGVRDRVDELARENPDEPQQSVIEFLDTLLDDYSGTVQQMDLNSLKAEYYLDFELAGEALNTLRAVDEDYPDDGTKTYYDRAFRYYSLLSDAYEQTGDQESANQVLEKIDGLVKARDGEQEVEEVEYV